MYAPAYFLLQRKKLRWCALFLLVGAAIYIGTFYLTNQDYVNQLFDTLDTQTSSSDDVWGQIYNAIQSEADKDYQEEVLMQEIIACVLPIQRLFLQRQFRRLYYLRQYFLL